VTNNYGFSDMKDKEEMSYKGVIFGVSIGLFVVYLDLWLRGSIEFPALLTISLLPMFIASIIISNSYEVQTSGS